MHFERGADEEQTAEAETGPKLCGRASAVGRLRVGPVSSTYLLVIL